MLSIEQINIINTIKENKNVICDAVAGSGKTTTILELAKALPEKLILQITYNSMLRHEVKDKARNIKNLKIHSYHSLYVNYYNNNAHTDNILNDIIINNKIPIKELPKFDIIVIDEVQDMTILFFSAIQKFINDLQKNVQYLILGDKNQAVYDFKGADNRFLTLAKDIYPNSVVLPLSQSFRVTKPIANFVNFVLLGEYRIKTVKKGSNVNYLICNTFKIYKYLIIKIKEFFNAGYKPEDIFVLCPSFKSKKLNPVKLLENELTKSNIPCYISLDTKLDDNYIKNKVVFTTFHQSKGRERKIVIIYNFDSSYFDFYNKTAPKYKCPASFYVAITRASEHLILLEDINYHPLQFLKYNYLEMSDTGLIDIQLIKHNLNNKKETNIPEIWINDLVKYIDDNKLNDINKYIDLTFNTPTNKFNNINIKTNNNINEINSLVISSIREYKYYNDMTIFNKTIDYIEQYLTNYITIFEKIVTKIETNMNIYNLSEIKKNCLKLKYSYLFWFDKFIQKINFPSDNINDNLYLANFYLSLVENVFFKLVDIKNYDWINKNQINTCIENMDNKIIKELEYEKIISFNYQSNKYGDLNIIGRINAYNHNNIYQIVSVDNINIEHLLDLICKAWLHLNINNNNKCNFYIYNIVTNELRQIINFDYINVIVELLLDNKLEKKYKNSDYEFINDCLNINENIHNLQPQNYQNKYLFI
jgi:nucleoside-triphosphatase THEP1